MATKSASNKATSSDKKPATTKVTKAKSDEAAPATRDAAAPAEALSPEAREQAMAAAKKRLGAADRNDPCPCGSGKKYKKCHLRDDEAASAAPVTPPDPQELIMNGWRLFEQRRPGAAEKEFAAALKLDATLQEARVGIGMARLSSGNNDGAKEELTAVMTAGEPIVAKLRADNVKDAFSKTEAQPFIRAAHALGCLAYDQDRFEDAVKDLARVYEIDEGSVGTEARLIASKSLMKLERAADAITVLEPATKAEGGSRAQLGLALAHFTAGDEAKARAALDAALDANVNYGKAILGRVRRRVENLAGTQPGSLEEALVYAQTYGDVWTDAAKALLETALDDRAAKKPSASSEDAAPAPLG
ncbi:MAG TPA: tetratricopeptide repeat protein [Polyangia bacterium]|jgi:tetratricopeptide (TPR) repeat protein|nr:tetratricopeptide repeat protein [Polyangia bacterium]